MWACASRQNGAMAWLEDDTAIYKPDEKQEQIATNLGPKSLQERVPKRWMCVPGCGITTTTITTMLLAGAGCRFGCRLQAAGSGSLEAAKSCYYHHHHYHYTAGCAGCGCGTRVRTNVGRRLGSLEFPIELACVSCALDGCRPAVRAGGWPLAAGRSGRRPAAGC